MTGGLGLKREEAVATANFSGSYSSEKPEARGRGLRTTVPSHSRGAVRRGEEGGWECSPVEARGVSPKRSARTRRRNLPEFVITHTRHDQSGGGTGKKGC